MSEDGKTESAKLSERIMTLSQMVAEVIIQTTALEERLQELQALLDQIELREARSNEL